MARKERNAEVDWDDVPDSNLLPDGGYLIRIGSIEDGETKNEPIRRLANMQAQVVEPEEYKGFPLYPMFLLGTEDDPDGDKRNTRRQMRGWKDLKKMLKAAGVPLSGDLEECFEAAEGQEVFALVVCSEGKGDYKGKYNNNVNGWYEAGARDPEVTGELPEGEGGTAEKPAKVKAAPKRRAVEEDEDEAPPRRKVKQKAKKAAPVEDEEETEDEEDDPPPRKAKSKANGRVRDEEDDEEDDDEEEEPPRRRRRARAEEEEDEDEDEPPTRRRAARPKAPESDDNRVPASDMRKCVLCEKKIPLKDFKEHVVTAHA